MYSIAKKCAAEFFGTAWLVFGGCGSAVLAAKFLNGAEQTNLGIGFVGVSLAFGLTVLTIFLDRTSSLHHRSGGWSHCGCGSPLCHRKR
jgi:glycerol uptake facilitator-like aquaporin